MSEDAEVAGGIATGDLIAGEIDRARRGAPAIGHSHEEPCANCGVERVGPYCHACGQVGHLHRNLGALVHDIAHGVFHFEGRIWRTLPLLAWHPGELTRRYVRGERARFVSPMALFLFSVFLMFAVASGLKGHKTEQSTHEQSAQVPDAAQAKQEAETRLATLRTVRASLPDTSAALAGIDAGIAAAERDLRALALPGKMRAMPRPDRHGAGISRKELEVKGFDSGLGWFDGIVAHAARNPELAAYKLKTYGYKYSWALIPISVPFIALLFLWRRGFGLYDHAIFAIYSLSFMSLATIALTVLGRVGAPAAILWPVATIVPPVHMYRQLKGAYGLRRFSALWRTCALLVFTFVAATLFLAFLIWLGRD